MTTATTSPALNTRSRNYYLGWTNSIETPAGERHWRFAEYGKSIGPLGAAGIIREYRELRQRNRGNEFAVTLWQGDSVLAVGSDVRALISEYEAMRELEAWKRRDA